MGSLASLADIALGMLCGFFLLRSAMGSTEIPRDTANQVPQSGTAPNSSIAMATKVSAGFHEMEPEPEPQPEVPMDVELILAAIQRIEALRIQVTHPITQSVLDLLGALLAEEDREALPVELSGLVRSFLEATR